MKTKQIISIAIGIMLVGGAFWIIRTGQLRNKNVTSNPPSPSVSEWTPDNSVATSSDSGKAEIVVSPGINITYNYATETPRSKSEDTQSYADAPLLNRPVFVPLGFSPEVASSTRADIATLIDAIKKSPGNGALWAKLGMKRKGIEDYEGAREAYAYALKLMPNNAVVSENLGVIYADYLKDYQKAEQYFRLAITMDPSVGYRYVRLFELYTYALEDAEKAKEVLIEGISAVPGDVSLKTLLENLK